MKCSICGHENPPGGGFCGGCGAWISSKSSAAQAPVPQQQAPVQPVVQTTLNEQPARQPLAQNSLNPQPAQQPPVQTPPPGYYPGPTPAGGAVPPPGGSGAGTPPEKPRKKKPVWLFILIPVLLVAALVVCYFTVHFWTDPSCTAPAECRLCGITQGSPIGHAWKDADCQNPRTCFNCGATKGAPQEHQWLEADCKTPSTCSLCGEQSGDPIGHEWMAADCTHPEICRHCGQAQGSPLGHNWLEPDCVTAKTCEICELTDGEPLGHDWEEATYEQPKTCRTCDVEEGDPKGYLGTLYGEWSDHQVQLNNSSVHYKIFDQEIKNCKRFTLNLNMKASSGSITGSWGLCVRTGNGPWRYIRTFVVSGEDTVLEFTFDESEEMTFDQITVALNNNKSCTYSAKIHLTDVQVWVD